MSRNKSSPSSDPSEQSSPAGEIIDMETFRQILDLDEDETHEFSAGMVWAYFSQARNTFENMDRALYATSYCISTVRTAHICLYAHSRAARDLSQLSELGHFLKGSSAALGVSKVQASCERMQHYGQRRDDQAGSDLAEDDALDRIRKLLSQVKTEYADAETWLKDWYREHNATPEDE